MGRRSRQRAIAPPAPAAPPPPAKPPAARAPVVRRSRPRARAAAPEAPWGSFPLVELCALAGIVLGVWGFATRNAVLITGAAFLGSVAGLEVAIREHFGGYRSHTLVLSGTLTVATLALLLLAGVARGALLTIAPLMLIAGFVVLRQLFKRRSGGAGMRVR